MESKCLSECGKVFVIDSEDKYQVEIEPGEYLLVEVGSMAGTAAAKLTHPNIATTAKRVYEFKWYRSNGSKHWTARAGVSHWLVIPRTAVTLIPEKGYSYVKAEINGVKVSFNVSGGGGEGWTDYLGTRTQISVNHKLADIRKLCEVAVRGTPLEPVTPEPLEPGQEDRWNQLFAGATPDVKEAIAALAGEAKNPVVKMLPGYSHMGHDQGVVVSVHRRMKKIPVPPAPGYSAAWKCEYTGAPKDFVLKIGVYHVRVKVGQVDWHATAQLNGLAAPTPAQVADAAINEMGGATEETA